MIYLGGIRNFLIKGNHFLVGEQTQANNKRIAKNTLLLYFRMLFTMAVQLYTTRVVLNTLGEQDYGVYNVVGGVVAMFGFLNAAMTTSTQRYITYELSKGDFDRLRKIFATSVNIHIVISVLVLILVETVGVWFLYYKMDIPAERMDAAMWVLQLSALTTVIAIMSYPYNAVIIAHEKMSAFAYISVIEVVLKLAVVYLLVIWSFDKLILYAILIAGIQLLIRFCYSGYCAKHFPETSYFYCFDKQLFKEMLGFAGWNLYGNLAVILFSQGLNMLLNVFFGPVVNAARAVAVQVQGAIQQFSTNFQMALNPQITKTYALGNLDEMHRLVYRSSKFTFMLLLVLCLPIIIEAPFILNIWLGEVPEHTVIFLRLILITSIIDASSNSLMVSAQATGNIKKYQSVVGGILLFILPISYLVLKIGGAPWSVFVVHLSVCCIAFVFRLIIIASLINLNKGEYLRKVILKCFVITLLSVFITSFIYLFLEDSVTSSILAIVLSVCSSASVSFFVGLDFNERRMIVNKVAEFLNKSKYCSN